VTDMRISLVVTKLAVAAATVAMLAGCSSGSWNILPDKKIDYKKERSGNPLEVPPDLTAPNRDDSMSVPELSASGTATYSDYASERQGPQATAGTSGVLPEHPNVKVERDGDRYWLVVKGDPAQVWSKVRQFWLENGFLLKIDNPTIGIMETNWAENRADIPQGPIRRVLGKVLGSAYSAATRDKFRVRLEHGTTPGTTELYLTQKGMEEEIQGSEYDSTGTIWKPRPEDKELEVEMLKRLMVYLGVEQKRAQQDVVRAQTARKAVAHMVAAGDGSATLVLNEDFSRAWRVVGIALDQVNFNVEDRDRARGIYYVQYDDPYKETKKKGFFSKLAFWRSDEKQPAGHYQVVLKSDGASTRVQVMDKDGKPETSGTGKRILTLLQEQFK